MTVMLNRPVCPHCCGTGFADSRPRVHLTVHGIKVAPAVGLLYTLLSDAKGRLLDYTYLTTQLGNARYADGHNVLKVYVVKLRKILAQSQSGEIIQVSPKIGYRLVHASQASATWERAA